MKPFFRRVTAACFSMAAVSRAVFAASPQDLRKAAALNEAATQKMKAGDIDGAETDLLAALEYSGQHPKVRKNLGVVYYEKSARLLKRGDYFEAQKYAKLSLETEPENKRYAKAYANSLSAEADARVKSGQNAEALALYEKAVRYDAENLSAWAQAAHYAWLTQRLDLARQYLDRARQLDPADKNVKILEEKLKNEKSSPVSASGSLLESLESEHFILLVNASVADSQTAGQILGELEKIYAETSYRLDFFPKNKIAVVFYPVSEFHEHWKLPSRVNGYYDGKLRIPYGKNSTMETLAPMIRHELTHAFVSAMTKKPVSQWLNEGLAQWMEGRALEIPSKDALVIYQLTGRLPDIERLDQALAAQKNPWNNTEMTVAYMKSFSLVQYLIEQSGVRNVVEYIKNRATEDGAGSQFKKYFSGTPPEVQDRWRQWLERQKSNLVFHKN